jgi:hypothetical protein
MVVQPYRTAVPEAETISMVLITSQSGIASPTTTPAYSAAG